MSQAAVDQEHVLVIPTQVLHDAGYFQGFHHDSQSYLDALLRDEHVQYRPRAEMEADPSFKQLIPYAIFRHRDAAGTVSLFQYTRGKGQGEQRLHSKRSIGVGGHISTHDADTPGSHAAYRQGLKREIEEEIHLDCEFQETCAGLINDDQTEVGRVHLGIVHLFDVSQPNIRGREKDLLDAGFRSVAEIWENRENFESWSQICLEALFDPASSR